MHLNENSRLTCWYVYKLLKTLHLTKGFEYVMEITVGSIGTMRFNLDSIMFPCVNKKCFSQKRHKYIYLKCNQSSHSNTRQRLAYFILHN